MKTVTIDNITDLVIDAMSDETSPRVREVLTGLVRHMHDFMGRAGKMTDDKRNEFILVADILGMESLVDAIAHNVQENETDSAILGPFFRQGAPELSAGETTAQRGEADGPSVLLRGRITAINGTPIANALINVWETGPEGLYEQQDPSQPDMNLRGQFRSDKNGAYLIRAVRPISYPIPFDGPGGDLLQITGRHPYRPAHIHMVVEAEGYRKLISQIYDSEDKYLESDSVFAVKGSLIVEFKTAPVDLGVDFVVDHNVTLKSTS